MLPLFNMLGGDGGYRADAVQFDGSNDFLTKTNDMMPDGKEGAISFWLNFTGADGAAQVMFSKEDGGAVLSLQLNRKSDNKFRLLGRNSSGTIILDLNTTGTKVIADGWFHFLASWNLVSAGARHIRINDVSDLNEVVFTNDTLDYTTGDGGSAVGAQFGGSAKLDADMADFWMDDSFIDFSAEANRRRFINPNGKPVNLGEAGQLPTGSSPIVFLSGPTVAWHTNKAAGGGFTENGTLTDGSSSPSD